MVEVVGKKPEVKANNDVVVSAGADVKIAGADKSKTVIDAAAKVTIADLLLKPLPIDSKKRKLTPLERKFDFDRNGKLDEAERAAYEKYVDLKKFDIDGDGKLDPAEKAAKETYKIMKMFDFNKNGKLDPEEKAALEAWKKAKSGKKPDGKKPFPFPIPFPFPFPIIKIGAEVGTIMTDDKKAEPIWG